MFFTLFWDLMY